MNKFKETALEAALKAGKLLEKNFKSASTFENKNRYDFVTESDTQSEKIIIDTIRNKFPNHTIISEESETLELNSDYKWIIDPLDSTTNFLSGIPYFSISLALEYKNEIILGVVHNPITKNTFSAIKNDGSFLNEQKIIAKKEIQLKDSIIVSGYKESVEGIIKGYKYTQELTIAAKRVIINFSPALDLCNIARGRINGIIDITSSEDHAAAYLILKEAGGIITNLDGSEFNHYSEGVIASGSNQVHQKLLNLYNDSQN